MCHQRTGKAFSTNFRPRLETCKVGAMPGCRQRCSCMEPQLRIPRLCDVPHFTASFRGPSETLKYNVLKLYFMTRDYTTSRTPTEALFLSHARRMAQLYRELCSALRLRHSPPLLKGFPSTLAGKQFRNDYRVRNKNNLITHKSTKSVFKLLNLEIIIHFSTHNHPFQIT